jgi:hypothetical protein
MSIRNPKRRARLCAKVIQVALSKNAYSCSGDRARKLADYTRLNILHCERLKHDLQNSHKSFLLLAISIPTCAGWSNIVTYTDSAAFLAALPGSAATLDFDSQAVATPIPSGSSLGGITFTYSIAGLTMQVVDNFDTTSGSNSLGLNDPGNFNQFIAGDGFDLNSGSLRPWSCTLSPLRIPCSPATFKS